jgi:hypothetical protein
MSNITFSWMLDQISKYVSVDEMVLIVDDRAKQAHSEELASDLRKHDLKAAEDKKKAAEGTWGQWANHTLASAASSLSHSLAPTKKAETDSYDMGWGTGIIIDSYTTMFHLNGSKPRTPGCYAKDSEPDTSGSSNEEIHPTVGYRYKMYKKLASTVNPKLLYQPAGGKIERNWNPKAGRWEYQFPEGKPLPEYKIKQNGFERLAMTDGGRRRDSDSKYKGRETSGKYIRRLDIQNGLAVNNDYPLSDEGSADEEWDALPVN